MNKLSLIKKKWWYRLWHTLTGGIALVVTAYAFYHAFSQGVYQSWDLYYAQFIFEMSIAPLLGAFILPVFVLLLSLLLFNRAIYIVFGKVKKDTTIVSKRWKKVITVYVGIITSLLVVALAWVGLDESSKNFSVFYNEVDLNSYTRSIDENYEGNVLPQFIAEPGDLKCYSEETEELGFYNKNSFSSAYCHPDLPNHVDEFVELLGSEEEVSFEELYSSEFLAAVEAATLETDSTGGQRVCFLTANDCVSTNLIKQPPNILYYLVLLLAFATPLLLVKYFGPKIWKR